MQARGDGAGDDEAVQRNVPSRGYHVRPVVEIIIQNDLHCDF